MIRKVVCSFALVALTAVLSGCKDEPTSKNFDPKGSQNMYSGNQQYSKGGNAPSKQ